MRKKILLFSLLLILYLFPNCVNATTYMANHYYTYKDSYHDTYLYEEVTNGCFNDKFTQDEENTPYENLLVYYNENYANIYPNYYTTITFTTYSGISLNESIKEVHLYASSYQSYAVYNDNKFTTYTGLHYSRPNDPLSYYKHIWFAYDCHSLSQIHDESDFVSSFDYYNNKTKLIETNSFILFAPSLNDYSGGFDKIQFPAYTDEQNSDNNIQSFVVNPNEYLPSYKSLHNHTYSNTYLDNFSNLTEVNLKNYNYVVLVPHYDDIKEELNNSYDNEIRTNFFIKGSYCPTALPGFGTIEYKDTVITQDGCYNSESLSDIGFYLNLNKMLNQEVYYIKPHKDYINNDNYIYFDSNYFDIIYITDNSCPVITYNNESHNAKCYNDIKFTSEDRHDLGYDQSDSEYEKNSLLARIGSFIKSIFVPSNDFLPNWFSEMNSALDENLGLLWYPFTFLANTLTRFANIPTQDDIGIINIPNINDPFYNHQIISARTINLNEIFTTGSFGTIHHYYLIIIDFIFYLLFIELCFNKFASLIKGHYLDSDSDVNDYEPQHAYKPKHSQGGGKK